MSEPGTWTVAVLALTAAALIGWDIYVAFFNRVPNDQDTISGIILGWSRQVWALPYAFGVIGGHLFLPASEFRPLQHIPSVVVLIGAGIAIGIVGLLARRSSKSWPIQSPVLLLIGGLMGHLFWPQ